MPLVQPLKIVGGVATRVPTSDDMQLNVVTAAQLVADDGATGSVVVLGAGETAPVSAAGFARLRYNDTLKRIEASTNTGPYHDIGLSQGSVVLVTPSGSQDYTTIAAALAAASSGDVVQVGPGSFSESVTIPAGVKLVGSGGTTTLAGSAATGVRATLGEGATIASMLVTMPTDANPAVLCAVATMATVEGVEFMGAGALGVGVKHAGPGTLFLDRVSYMGGTAGTFVDVASGTVQGVEVFVFSGTLTTVVSVAGGAFDFVELEVATSATATDGILVGAGGSVRGQVGRLLSGLTNALHVTSNTASLLLEATDIEAITWDILADPAVTAATVRISSTNMSTDRISASGALRSSPTWLLTYLDSKPGDQALRVNGEFSVGSPEDPSEAVFGEGDSYTLGMVVITTDGTAGPASDGGNLTDVSAAAQSASGSTFGFQGVTAGHAIMFGSTRSSASSVLKHWGVKLKQLAAAVEVTPRSFVIEIWDGAAWVGVGIMATHAALFWRYSNEMFIRGNDSEHLRFGIDENTNWITKAISGKTLFWSRIRIATTLTTAPVFEQSKLSTSRFEANGDGTGTYHGIARFRQTIANAGNVFGESGGVVQFNKPVGLGGLPTGWNHRMKNSLLNGAGDAIYMQFVIPRGTDTSFPLRFRAYYSPVSAGLADVSVILSALPLEVTGVLVADPAGGITPLPRTLANTDAVTANPGVAVTKTIDTTDNTKMQSVDFEPFPINDYYEGDMIMVRFELDSVGAGAATIGIAAMEVSGVQWTHGEHL